jgi:maleate isomerase
VSSNVISIGVLTPHAAAGPEVEFADMAAGQVVTRISRIPAPGAGGAAQGTPPTAPSGLQALTAPAVLDDAAAAFDPGSVEALGYASTSTAYAIGFAAETALVERLAHRWDLPAVGSSSAAVAALQTLDVERVALVHPPWFDAELNDLGAHYFRDQGFEVVESESADLPNDPNRIEPGGIIEWISRHLHDDAEAVFIGGTGFRAAGAIEALEEELGRPVVESNQALLWAILPKTQARFKVSGYGRLFDHGPSAR